MSVLDTIAAITRTIPVMMATANLQYRVATNAPTGDVSPRTYGPWTFVVATWIEHSMAQVLNETQKRYMRRRTGHMTVPDTIVIPEGSQLGIGPILGSPVSTTIFAISAEQGTHRLAPGIIVYAAYRNEALIVDAGRQGGV
jgi:hypothetical protein